MRWVFKVLACHDAALGLLPVDLRPSVPRFGSIHWPKVGFLGRILGNLRLVHAHFEAPRVPLMSLGRSFRMSRTATTRQQHHQQQQHGQPHPRQRVLARMVLEQFTSRVSRAPIFSLQRLAFWLSDTCRRMLTIGILVRLVSVKGCRTSSCKCRMLVRKVRSTWHCSWYACTCV